MQVVGVQSSKSLEKSDLCVRTEMYEQCMNVCTHVKMIYIVHTCVHVYECHMVVMFYVLRRGRVMCNVRGLFSFSSRTCKVHR